jgi:molecular chaperone GrpE
MEKKQEIPIDKGEKKEETLATGVQETKEAAPNAEPASPEQKIAELEQKLADLNDQFLRKAADFENFRKRTVREKQELIDFANQNLLLDLLPVIDDFERAIKSAETSKDFHSFYEGVTLIEKRLSTQLENKWGLKRFDSAGELFDPTRHEAIQMEKADGITEATVKDDYVKGYFLKDRMIRFAKVKVLMPKEQGTESKEQ